MQTYSEIKWNGISSTSYDFKVFGEVYYMYSNILHSMPPTNHFLKFNICLLVKANHLIIF